MGDADSTADETLCILLETESIRFHRILTALMEDRVAIGTLLLDDASAMDYEPFSIHKAYNGWEQAYPDIRKIVQQIKSNDFFIRQLANITVVYEELYKLQMHLDCDTATSSQLFRSIFGFLRSGYIDSGIEVAEKCGRHDISALLRGAPPFTADRLPASGSSGLGLWLSAASELARTAHDPYEAAVFGVLSGEVDPVLAVCRTAEDKLWAVLRCALHAHLVNGINMLADHSGVSYTLPLSASHGRLVAMPVSAMFSPDLIGHWAATPALDVERHLIEGDIPAALSLMASTAPGPDDLAYALTALALRDVFHVPVDAAHVETTVIRHLAGMVDEGDPMSALTQPPHGAVASYPMLVARLPPALHASLMARLLGSITDSEDRAEALKRTEEQGIDTADVATVTTDALFDEYATSRDPIDQDVAAKAAEWLYLDPDTRLTAMGRTLDHLRRFLAAGNTDLAAKMLREVVPTNFRAAASDDLVEGTLVTLIQSVGLFTEVRNCFEDFIASLDSEESGIAQIQSQRFNAIVGGISTILTPVAPTPLWLADPAPSPELTDALVTYEGCRTAGNRSELTIRARVAVYSQCCDMLLYLSAAVPDPAQRAELTRLAITGAAGDHVRGVLERSKFIGRFLQRVGLMLADSPTMVDMIR